VAAILEAPFSVVSSSASGAGTGAGAGVTTGAGAGAADGIGGGVMVLNGGGIMLGIGGDGTVGVLGGITTVPPLVGVLFPLALNPSPQSSVHPTSLSLKPGESRAGLSLSSGLTLNT
jgi:hypothetical protein